MEMVKQYVCRATSADRDNTYILNFTQIQADEVGAVLHPTGLNIISAEKLCAKWTREGSAFRSDFDIKFSYKVYKEPN